MTLQCRQLNNTLRVIYFRALIFSAVNRYIKIQVLEPEVIYLDEQHGNSGTIVLS